MKKMKKLAAMLIAVVMAMSLAVPAMAASEGSITITNTVANLTYNLYKVFDVEIKDGSYYYTPTANWVEFFNTGAGRTYGSVAGNGYISWKNATLFSSDAVAAGNEMASLAKHAQEYAEDENLTPDATAKSEGTSLTIEGLDSDSYYLINSSAGSLAMAGPIDNSGTFTIDEKNDSSGVPSIRKTVGNNNTEFMSVDVGAVYDYTITVTFNEVVSADSVPTLTDVLPRHIDVTAGSFKAVLNKTTPLVPDTDYTVTRDITTTTTTTTHQVKFHHDFAKGDILTMTYTAKLVSYDDSAPVVHETYTNRAMFTYGEKEISDTASVFTLAINGWKFYTDDEGMTHDLPGAKFVLKNSAGKYYNIINNVVSWVDDESNATTVTSDDNGNFRFYGIAKGEYTLEETEAPAGYTGASEQTVTLDATSAEVQVENIPGTSTPLPETGGMGTTIFYIAGSILMLGAAVLLITKKRSKAE